MNVSEDDQDRAKEKGRLEVDKLALEVRNLEHELSVWGRLRQLLQALSAPVALVGAILAALAAYGQLNEASRTHEFERFEKILGRSASEHSEDRVLAIAELQPYIDMESSFQISALQYLINALSVEKDPRVSGSISDIFAHLDPKKVSMENLNTVLGTAIERNKVLTQDIISSLRAQIDADKVRNAIKNGLIPIGSQDIPMSLISKMEPRKYLEILDFEREPFEDLVAADRVPLENLARVIITLLNMGASAKDFRGIFCEHCDFTKAKGLESTTFDNAHVGWANFSGAKLNKSSFFNTDIRGVSFFNSDLTGANLRQEETVEAVRLMPPLLECAKLKGADLTGMLLGIIEYDFYESDFRPTIIVPGFAHAEVDEKTKLNWFKINVYYRIPDHILLSNKNDNTIKYVLNDRKYPNIKTPLLEEQMPASVRHRADNYGNEGGFVEASASIYMNELHINNIPKQNLPFFRDYGPALLNIFDRTATNKLQAVSKFISSLKSLGTSGARYDSKIRYNAPSCSSGKSPDLMDLIISSKF